MWEAGGGEGDLVGLDVMTCKNIRTINVDGKFLLGGDNWEHGRLYPDLLVSSVATARLL
jgi:hypothetical protein